MADKLDSVELREHSGQILRFSLYEDGRALIYHNTDKPINFAYFLHLEAEEVVLLSAFLKNAISKQVAFKVEESLGK